MHWSKGRWTKERLYRLQQKMRRRFSKRARERRLKEEKSGKFDVSAACGAFRKKHPKSCINCQSRSSKILTDPALGDALVHCKKKGWTNIPTKCAEHERAH